MMKCDWAKPLAIRGLARLMGGYLFHNVDDWSAEIVDHVDVRGRVIGTTYHYLNLEWIEDFTIPTA